MNQTTIKLVLIENNDFNNSNQPLYYKVYSSIVEINEADWNHFVPSSRFFLSYEYLTHLERACPFLSYYYIVISNSHNDFKGICTFQISKIKGKNLLGYLPKKNKVIDFIASQCLSLIDTTLVSLGNIIFTCESGWYMDDSLRPHLVYYINESVKHLIPHLQSNPSGIMISEELTLMNQKAFQKYHFNDFEVESKMVFDTRPFSSFDEYVNQLSSKYRVRKNKIYKNNEAINVFEIDRHSIDLYNESIFDLFQQVVSHSKFNLISITPNYFREFLQLPSQKFRLLAFESNGELVGFISYFELPNDIEIHYVGINYQYNKEQKIYNYMLYKMLELGFSKNVKSICFSRTAQEIKSTLGANETKVYSYLKIQNPLLKCLAPFLMKQLKPETHILRSPFKK